MRFDCVDRILTKLFFKFGAYVARNPYYFIIIPLAVSVCLLTGLQRLKYEDDPEFLFSPTDGLAKAERKAFESNFHLNYSEFNPGRLTRAGKFGRIIVTPKKGWSVLTSEVFQDILAIDKIVQSINITYDEDEFAYKDMCATWQGHCYRNDVLDLVQYPWGTSQYLSFPIGEEYLYTPKPLYLPGIFGGIETSGDHMMDAKAIRMQWFLRGGTPKEKRKGTIWEAAFLKKLAEVDLPNVRIYRFVSDTIEKELERNAFGIIPYFIISVMTMLVFTFVALSMSDSVKSKPSLGCVGVLSAMLGTGAAFGLLSYVGLEFITINMAAPFLMLGIGMDDTFVMLASWRKTKSQDSLEKRMGEMFSDAAVSISITSLTDMLSFWIGVATPFPCVRIFCIYTALAVLFTFIYHVTFFAACMAIAGRFETQNRHGVLPCVKSTPKSLAEDRNCCFRLCCTGGINPNDPYNPKDNEDHLLMKFFKDGVGNFLSLPPMKILVLFTFIAYLGVAIWNCTKLKEGLQLRRLSQADSYSVDFYDNEDRFFRQYSYRIQVIIDQPLNYSNPVVQDEIEDLLQRFENSKYIANSNMTESWLRDFKDTRERYYFQDSMVANDTEFISELKEMLLDIPRGKRYRNDIRFSNNYTSIASSRFVLQSQNIWNTYIESQMLSEMREIAASSKFNVHTFHQYFIFMDQYLVIRKVTIQAVVAAAIIMTIISLIFIPSPLCALWVGFSIVSIEIGVVGYMALWNVYLDGISMINLIMCIGFSVDFSAHVSYAYISSKEKEPNARMKDALYSLGLPILQGATSTFLSVSFLLLSNSYIFITFFKTVFLVIFFGAVHGLFLLPVMLSLIGPGSCSKPVSSEKTKPVLISIVDNAKSNVITSNLSTMAIPRPKTNPTIIKKDSIDSVNKYFKESSQDLERDPGIGTSAEENSDVSNEKGSDESDNVSECKKEPIYTVLNDANSFPAAFQHMYDNKAYSSEEDEVAVLPRKDPVRSASHSAHSRRRNAAVNSAENRNANEAWLEKSGNDDNKYYFHRKS